MKFNTAHLFITLLLCLSFNLAKAQKSFDSQIPSIINLFNEQKYSESLDILRKYRTQNFKYPIWYYYVGANLTYQNKAQAAIDNLTAYNNKVPIGATAKSHYYIGLNYFNQKNFESAINNLELALDISKDNKLDEDIENLIEKTIRHQKYFENSYANNLTLLLGYGYDSNRIDISPSTFTSSLVGHTANYGLSYAYKLVDDYATTLIPSLTLLDGYTLTDQFKSESTVQAIDAFQINASIPLVIINEDVQNSRYELSLNYTSIYLPVNSSAREQTLDSYYFSGFLSHPIFSESALSYKVGLAYDKAFNFSTADYDASGIRTSFLTTLKNYFGGTDPYQNLQTSVKYESANTTGSEVKYNKLSGTISYGFSFFFDSIATFGVQYADLKYPDKATPRSDKQTTLNFEMIKYLNSSQTIGLSASSVNNDSNIENNIYNDYTLGLNYSKTFSF